MGEVTFAEAVAFGSHFGMGAVQAGMTMKAKVERPDAFGAWNALSNRHILGDDWELQVDRTNDGFGWDVVPVDVIVANPPCSGFSNLTRAEGFRGINSPANVHMHAVIGYTARVRPQVLVLESVQETYHQGIELMRALRANLEEETGDQWSLTHVLHNGLSLGNACLRRRYFLVASRIPFGVEPYDLKYVPTADDALHDLEPLADTWERQPYRSPPTRWSKRLRSSDGFVDGCATLQSPGWMRAREVADNIGGWPQGWAFEDVCKLHYQQFGRLPGDPNGATLRDRGFQYIAATGGKTREQHLVERDFSMGPTQLTRWRANRHGYVITGGALTEYVHPHVLRPFTHRDAARLMGFPDDWRIRPHRFDKNLPAVWGKGAVVDSCRWITHWVKESIEGRPGGMTGWPPKNAEERELTIDVTHDWKKLLPRGHKAYLNETKADDAPKPEWVPIGERSA